MTDFYADVVGTTITVHRSAGLDQWGDDQAETTHIIDRIVWAPSTSTEADDTAATVITGRQIYGPPGPDLRASDTISFPGDPASVRWQVDGDIGPWVDPFTGSPVGFEAAVRKVSG